MQESEYFKKVCEDLGLTTQHERDIARRIIGVPWRDVSELRPLLRSPDNQRKKLVYTIDEIRAIRNACISYRVEGFALDLLDAGLTVDQARERLRATDEIVRREEEQSRRRASARAGRTVRAIR